MPAKRRHFINHLHPHSVYARTLHPLSTLGLGMASLTCMGVLFVTGITLFLYYIPDQDRAYERILHITTTLRYGGLVRNLHYVAANALVILTWLHLARVFLTGSYKGHRLTWNYGLGLLCLVLLANFTGYLLAWDQISYWAIKVGSSLANYLPFVGPGLRRFMLAGDDIGNDTLARSFAFHAGVVPLSLLLLTSLHLWRLRREGGLAAPPAAKEHRLPAKPWLYRAEGAVALLTLGSLFLLSLLVHAPIFERANPLHPPNPAKAPWYFVGLQEMVSHSAFFGAVVAPFTIGFFLFLAPFFDRSKSPGGVWFARDRRLVNMLFCSLFLSQIVFILIGQWFRGKNWMFQIPF